MASPNKNPLARVERPKRNYPLIAAAVILIGLLLAGIGLAARDGNFVLIAIFVAALMLLAIVLLLDVAEKRRLEAIDDRKFIHWDAAMPEVQRQNVNLEVRELGRLLNVGAGQLTDLLSAYVVA